MLKWRLRTCGILYLFLSSEKEESGLMFTQVNDCNDGPWNLECIKKK